MISKKDLEMKIRGVQARTRNLRTDIQNLSVEIILHAFVHGDVTLADSMMAALRAMDRQTWAVWITSHGPFTLNKTSGKFNLNREKRKNYITNTEEELRDLLASVGDWWEATKSVKEIARALDVASKIQSVATSISNAVSENKDVKVDKDAIRSALKNLQLALRALEHGEDVKSVDEAKRNAPNQFRRLTAA